MNRPPSTGLLLINLGTPDGPDAASVRRYLRQFLLDPRVLDIGGVRRSLLVRGVILRTRPRESAAAYAKIWTDRGSPLLWHSQDLAHAVQQRLGEQVQVELAMRYGNPSIAHGLTRLRDCGVDRVVVFPLYPQYASSSTGSSVEEAYSVAGRLWNTPFVQVVPPFFDHPAYIEAAAQVARDRLAAFAPDKILFSYHGLPVRHCTKSDDSGNHCFTRSDCCDQIGIANRNCYRAQCVATTELLAARLEISPDQRVICFQSRLGRTPWIKPYTDHVIRELAASGVRRLAVLSPAFVADCLETLEELGMRAAEDFQQHGGEALELVPSLNATGPWIDAVVRIARDASGWLN